MNLFLLILSFLLIAVKKKKIYKRMFVPSVSISKEDFESYLMNDASKNIKNFVNNCDEDDFIECKVLSLKNECEWMYDELWFVDTCKEGGGYEVLLKQNINTSSPFAAWECGIYPDIDEDDEEEIEYNTYTIERLLDLIRPNYRELIEKLLKKKYNYLFNQE
jgi:hypothetical protein